MVVAPPSYGMTGDVEGIADTSGGDDKELVALVS